MRTTFGVTLLFFCMAWPSLAQHQMLGEAFQDFSYSRFLNYEPITITWNMEGTLQADLNDGINYLFEERPDLAEASLSTVIKKDSSLWQAFYFRAAARKQLNKLSAAHNDIQRSLKLNPNLYEGLVELAKVYYLHDQMAESGRAIRKAIQLNKANPIAHYLKGDIELAQNQVKAATKSFNDCLTADSLFHDARIKLAIIDFLTSKNQTLAIQHLDNVLETDSLQRSALMFRSIFLYDKNKEQSARDLSRLILVSPNNLMAYFLRGVLLTELEQYDRAFADFHQVIHETSTSDNNFVGKQTWLDKKIDLQNVGAYALTRVYGLPDDEGPKLKQAYCHIVTGAFDKSIVVINETPNPNEEPLAVYLKAVAYEHKGEHPKAFQFYNLALQLDDEIVDAYKKRGIYRQELQQWDKSIEDFSTVLSLDPGVFLTYRIRGVSYFYANQFGKAIADYTEYLKSDSTNKEVIGYRGMAYLKNSQRLNAYIDFAMSDNQKAFDFNDMNRLVDSVLVQGDTALALYALDKFTASVSYYTEAFVRKFKIHLTREEWKPIERDIMRAVRNSRADVPRTDHAYLLTLQAMYYSRNRHDADALKTLDEAIRFDKKNAMAYYERGKLLLARGKVSKAESDLKLAASLGYEQATKLLAERLTSSN